MNDCRLNMNILVYNFFQRTFIYLLPDFIIVGNDTCETLENNKIEWVPNKPKSSSVRAVIEKYIDIRSSEQAIQSLSLRLQFFFD